MPDNIDEFTAAMSRLAAKTRNLKPTLSAIGAYQDRRYQQSFDANQAPDGEPWTPLSESTLAQKQNPKALVEEIGRIPGSRFYEATNTSVEVGYGDPLAALHNDGFTIPARTVIPKNRQALYFAGARHPFKRANIPETNVPARRLIGFTEQDVKEWENIVLDDIVGEFDD